MSLVYPLSINIISICTELYYEEVSYSLSPIFSPNPSKPSCATFRPASSVAKLTALSSGQASAASVPWQIRA